MPFDRDFSGAAPWPMIIGSCRTFLDRLGPAIDEWVDAPVRETVRPGPDQLPWLATAAVNVAHSRRT